MSRAVSGFRWSSVSTLLNERSLFAEVSYAIRPGQYIGREAYKMATDQLINFDLITWTTRKNNENL